MPGDQYVLDSVMFVFTAYGFECTLHTALRLTDVVRCDFHPGVYIALIVCAVNSKDSEELFDIFCCFVWQIIKATGNRLRCGET